MRKFLKKLKNSKVNQRIFYSLKRISFVLTATMLAICYGQITGTNAYFNSYSVSNNNTFTAGYWIPELSQSVSPAKPDGCGSWYATQPCITLTSSLSDVTVYWEFTHNSSSVSGSFTYPGACVPVPEGEWDFSAYAVNNANSNWKSNTVAGHFKYGNPPAQAGDIVINEIMWMGSTVSQYDEWIELRNMTSCPIDISGWKIEKAASGGGTLTIPNGKSIPANGFFLISNYGKDNSNSALNVSPDWVTTSVSLSDSNNGNLKLRDKDGNKIDEAKDGSSWPAGQNSGGYKKSMERNNTPGDGTQSGSWHTCNDSACNDTTYWDSENNNYGTPGAANLSSNDPTSEDYDETLILKEEPVENELLDNNEEPAGEEISCDPETDENCVENINNEDESDEKLSKELEEAEEPEIITEKTDNKENGAIEESVKEENKNEDAINEKTETDKDGEDKDEDKSEEDKDGKNEEENEIKN